MERGTSAPLVDLSHLSPVAEKSRALSEGLWGRAFLTAYARFTDAERVRLIEGLSKGEGLALLAVPIIEAFTFTQAQWPNSGGSSSRNSALRETSACRTRATLVMASSAFSQGRQ